MIIEFLADGFEEAEALVTVDFLRRCGFDVCTVSITERKTVKGAHGINVEADTTANQADFNDFEAVILPGGMPGSDYLEQSEDVKAALMRAKEKNKLICAICAAPKVLGAHGILQGKKAVCYPGFEDKLTGAEVMQNPVMCDGNIVTARAAGCVFDFALAIAKKLGKENEAESVKKSILYNL